MTTKTEVLQACTIQGNIVKLPEQLDRKLYQETAKALELIGGKWTRSLQGFLFPQPPGDLLKQIANGTKVNLKKDFQYFPTPDHLADRLVKMAGIKEMDSVLEPSAGQGAIVKAIQRNTWRNRTVFCYELMEVNQTFLSQIAGIVMLGNDFPKECKHMAFDKIIANPPFSGNQDIDHIIKMYKVLAPGGRIVTIASKHWQFDSHKKESQFRAWLEEIGAEIHDIPAGEFKESGTSISTCIIQIDK